MKLNKIHYAVIFAAVLLAAAITYQSINYEPISGKSFSNIEALSSLAKTQAEGRQLSQAEIESRQFNNLKLKIDGMSCISCSDTVFYGLINMKGIANAKIQDGVSCIIYDKSKISRKDIMNSELFQSGVYMAAAQDEITIHSKEDAKCL